MCNKINITPKLAIEGEDRTLGAVPVSYTHLDVYKRQVLR